jgi:hypothetical protein
MSAPKASIGDGHTAGSLQTRLDHLKHELAAQSRRTNFSTFLTLVIGALALSALGFYFVYGYNQFQEVTRPEKLIDTADGMISQSLPEARKSLEDEVAKSAPVLADRLSKQALASLPQAREKLRDYSLARVDSSIDEATLISEDQFRTFLRKNHEKLAEELKDLSTSPKLTESKLEELVKLMEAELQTNMSAQSAELLTALRSANEKLTKLASGAQLAPQEQRERRVAMLLRRLQEQENATSTGIPAPLDVPVSSQKVRPGIGAPKAKRVGDSDKVEEKAAAPETKAADAKPEK